MTAENAGTRIRFPRYLPDDLAEMIGRLKFRGWRFSLWRGAGPGRVRAHASLGAFELRIEIQGDVEEALRHLISEMKVSLT